MRCVLGILLLLQLSWSFNTSLKDRLNCYLEVNFKVEQKSCEERGCIWDSQKRADGIPICYLDTKKVGYKRVNDIKHTTNGLEVNLQLKSTANSTFKNEKQIENLKFEVTYLTHQILRFKIVDPNNDRYEVPVQKNFPLLQNGVQMSDESKRIYSIQISESKDDFNFAVIRKSSKTKLFDTSIGGLIYSDQFLQIATKLPTNNVYGLGENFHRSLRHDMTRYETFPIFTQDYVLGPEQMNEYGMHPFYTCLEMDGKSHGILLLNSNAMEYTLLPEPGLSLKTVGGVLDFFVFVGNNPENVIQLYTLLIGRPVMPPFWGLGFQLSRWGFRNTSEVQKVIERNIKASVPLDVMYLDIDYMEAGHDFSYNHNNFAQLPSLIKNTKEEYNLHWAFILDPPIEALTDSYPPFMDGYNREVYIKWDKRVPKEKRWNPPNVPSDKDVIYGHEAPKGPVAFPDFFKNSTQEWWQKWLAYFHNYLNIKFDALWIDMNEPYNGNDYAYKCPLNKYDYPEVRIKPTYARSGEKSLSHNTLCMLTNQGQQNEFLHYDVHSLYGLTELMATQKAVHTITGKRGFVLTRSTYVSSGRYGAHWSGDNASKWTHMKWSIIGILEMNLFGIPFVGADICGFNDNTTAQLCKRWGALGAFYPFSRNHNCMGNIDQDPAVWAERGHLEVTQSIKDSLIIRYTLLPHIYTLFFRAHVFGNTVVRPLFHEFPTDENTFGIDEQFMLGSSLLISPFLYENQTEVKAYLPNDVWYEGTEGLPKVNKTGYITIPDNKYGIPPFHIRGNTIIPISGLENHTNTKTVRNSEIQLFVFPGRDKTAFGELFWDDGESIDTIENNRYNYYTIHLMSNCVLQLNVEKSGYSSNQTIGLIRVFGTNDDRVESTLDGKPITSESQTYLDFEVNINLSSKKFGEKWILKWKSMKTNFCNIL